MFKRFTIASAVFLALFVGLLLLSYTTSPYDRYLSLGRSFHIGIGDGRVSLFNDAKSGRYRGSIIEILGANDTPNPRLHKTGYDFPGFYYRHFRYLNGSQVPASGTLWILTISFLWPIGLTAVLPTVALLRSRRSRPTI
jgi:hypothetical protein